MAERSGGTGGKAAAKKAPSGPPAKRAGRRATTAPPARKVDAGPARPAEEYADIRRVLTERAQELRDEHRRALADIDDLQRDRLTDAAGDDEADTGTKAFEREQEISLARGMLERLGQVEHALARLDEGTYGRCEKCGNAIPTARLEAFPAVTLCVSCKQLEERR